MNRPSRASSQHRPDAARDLGQSGVVLERFDGLEQDDLGIWTAPGGAASVAWFKNPDGNVLSISQHS